VEITVDNRFVDIVGEGYDLGVRLGDDVAKDMVALRISPPLTMTLVASPQYLRDNPPPQTVDDLQHHRLIGLRPDYTTLRHEDADRYELFLRDLWRTRLGANAAVLPRLDFAPADDGEGDVCRVTVPPSPVPVYLSGPKGKGGRELWVRAGNSTQRLEVDDAIAYVTQRWPHTVRPSLRSRIGTYLLYHRRPAGASADGDRTPGGLLG